MKGGVIRPRRAVLRRGIHLYASWYPLLVVPANRRQRQTFIRHGTPTKRLRSSPTCENRCADRGRVPGEENGDPWPDLRLTCAPPRVLPSYRKRNKIADFPQRDCQTLRGGSPHDQDNSGPGSRASHSRYRRGCYGRRRPNTTAVAGISDPNVIRAGVPWRTGLPAALLTGDACLRVRVRPLDRDVELAKRPVSRLAAPR
jgi:hypothetical protein